MEVTIAVPPSTSIFIVGVLGGTAIVFAKMKFKENVNLAPYSNYKIGGPAKFFFEAKSAEEIELAISEAKKEGLKIFVLGGGTNLLIGDAGYNGLVLKPNINFLKSSGTTIEAGAGVLMSGLLDFAAKNSLSGLEWAGGLPGTLGGAIRGNAGAFGGEIKDSVEKVESFDAENGELRSRNNKECEFDYRNSIFKKLNGREIILSATFELKKGDPAEIKKSILDKIEYRKSRQPLEYPNIGSIFKNVPLAQIDADITQIDADTIRVHPRGNQRLSAFTALVKMDPFPIVPTARLITLAGLKGMRSGGAMISEKHGNFIVNVGNATADDVKKLIKIIKEEVNKKFGIKLEEEIQLI